MSVLLERLFGSIIGLITFSLVVLPYYFISKKYFEEYALPVSLGISISCSIFIGYILQAFSALAIFPLVVVASYLVAYRYGEPNFKLDRALAGLMVLGFSSRWIPNFFTGVVPNYLVPSGNDQKHHLYLTEIISDAGTVPETWQAGFNLPIYYNPGFALLAASIDQIPFTDPMGLLYSVPFMMSTAFGLLMYPVCKELGFERKYSLFSVVVILFGSYSMFVVHAFGGYAQLASMVAMATSVVFFLRYRRERSRIDFIFLVVSIAAMGLSHYYVAIFLGIFFGFYLLRERSKDALLDMSLPGATAIILTLPWFLTALNSIPESTTSSILSFNSLTPGFDPIYMIFLSLGPLSVLLALFYRKMSELDVYAAWGSLVLMLSQTAVFGVFILIGSRWWHGAVLPLGVLAASGAKEIHRKYVSDYLTFRNFMAIFLIVNLVGVSLMYNYRYTQNLRFTTTQDYQTFEYIEENTSKDVLIHNSGRAGQWTLPVAEKNITSPFLPVTPERVNENMKEYDRLYQNRNWEKLEQKGVDYYFIDERSEKIPETCLREYKSLYRCG